jgi:hypothetical protein
MPRQALKAREGLNLEATLRRLLARHPVVTSGKRSGKQREVRGSGQNIDAKRTTFLIAQAATEARRTLET